MRNNTSAQRIVTGFLTILVSVVFSHAVTAQCPPQTVRNAAGECILTSDVQLKVAETIFLSSNTTLNCQSHKISPAPTPTPATFTPSSPEVAVFLNDAKNVKIKNCRIENFDFGIFAINSKRDPDNDIPPIQISHNDITARFVGISFMSVDNSEIRRNDLTVTKKGGRGIYVGRDSDRNRILNNTIDVRIPTGDLTPAFRVPGFGFASNLPSNPSLAEGSAVLIAQTEGREPSLLNAIIRDKSLALCGTAICVFQLTVTDSAEPNALFTEGNIVDGNLITIEKATEPVDGVVLSLPQGTRVSNNRINGARFGVRVGIQVGRQKAFPGICKKSGRFCLVDTVAPVNKDCNIPNFDPPNNADECQGTTSRLVSWVSRNSVIQDNRIAIAIITQPALVGISTTGEGTIITGNRITRPDNTPETDPKTGTGITLVGPFALEGSPPLHLSQTVVTRNIVRDIRVALNLIQSLPDVSGFSANSFKAKIGLNDFTGYIAAVVISKAPPPPGDNTYSLDSQLSSILEGSPLPRGNFWGSCPFDPNKVLNSDTTPQALPRVIDSHPFRSRVALIPGSAPTPCP